MTRNKGLGHKTLWQLLVLIAEKIVG